MSAALDTEQVIARINAIIQELEALRQQLVAPTPRALNFTEALFGSLGHGAWEEYDLHLDWARFGA